MYVIMTQFFESTFFNKRQLNRTFLFDQLTRLYLCMWQIAKKFFCYDFD